MSLEIYLLKPSKKESIFRGNKTYREQEEDTIPTTIQEVDTPQSTIEFSNFW